MGSETRELSGIESAGNATKVEDQTRGGGGGGGGGGGNGRGAQATKYIQDFSGGRFTRNTVFGS